MRQLWFNGPVQNGDFTFAETPGKHVGIRLAEAHNTLLGATAVPHLWNTSTLAGDLRHRQHAPGHARADYETALIAAKYGDSLPPCSTMTDTDPAAATLALEIIDRRLSAGTLAISRETVHRCTQCGHMIGPVAHPCRACGATTSRPHTARQLVADRDPTRPVIGRDDIHAYRRRHPLHLQNTAANVPQRLLLSRTRDHGIRLDPLGLPGLVLDSRAGLHVTVLAAARERHADVAVMTITPNAAVNICAYGQSFRAHAGHRLRYALHGRVPYQALSGGTGSVFASWFLPLWAFKQKQGIPPSQLPELSVYFRRTLVQRPTEPDEQALRDVRQAIEEGDADWVTRRNLLATALLTSSPA